MTGLTVTLRCRRNSLQLVEQDRPDPFHPRHGRVTAWTLGAGDRLVGQVHIDDCRSDRPASLRRFAAAIGVLAAVGSYEVEQLQGGLRAGDDPDRLGAADVDVVGVAEGGQRGGDLVDTGVEGVDVGGCAAQERRLVAVVGLAADEDALPVPGSRRLGLGLGRVGLGDGGVDIRFETPPGHRGDVAGDLAVDQGGRGRGEPAGLLGDLAAYPRLGQPVAHQLPQLRQPVPKIQSVPDQHRRRSDRQPQLGTELGRRELGHLRSPVATQTDQPLHPGNRPAHRVQDGVQVSPMRRHLQHLRLRQVDLAGHVGGIDERLGRVERVQAVHRPDRLLQSLAHVFYYRRSQGQGHALMPFSTRPIGSQLLVLSQMLKRLREPQARPSLPSPPKVLSGYPRHPL